MGSLIALEEMGKCMLTVKQLDAALKNPKNKPSFEQKMMGAAMIFVGAGGKLGGKVYVKDVMSFLYKAGKSTPDEKMKIVAEAAKKQSTYQITTNIREDYPVYENDFTEEGCFPETTFRGNPIL
jgi:hypothetical protein